MLQSKQRCIGDDAYVFELLIVTHSGLHTCDHFVYRKSLPLSSPSVLFRPDCLDLPNSARSTRPSGSKYAIPEDYKSIVTHQRRTGLPSISALTGANSVARHTCMVHQYWIRGITPKSTVGTVEGPHLAKMLYTV